MQNADKSRKDVVMNTEDYIKAWKDHLENNFIKN